MSFPTGPHEEERLQALQETGAFDSRPDQALDRICEEVRQHFGVPICTVTLIGRSQLRIKAAQGLQAGESPRQTAFCNYTIMSDDVFVVEDMLSDQRFRDNPFVTGAPHIRFYAGAPLIYLSNIRLGALCLLDTKPRTLSRGDKAELSLFADSAVREIAARELAANAQA